MVSKQDIPYNKASMTWETIIVNRLEDLKGKTCSMIKPLELPFTKKSVR